MDLLPFLQAVLPAKGYFFLATPAKKGIGFHHQAFTSVKDLSIRIRAKIDATPNVAIYHAMASFTDPPGYSSINGSYTSNRKQEKVDLLRTLWIDVDVGPEATKYPTKLAAAQALAALVAAGKIPQPSYIVDSGGGFHIYWVGDTDIDLATWRPIADGFKHHLIGLGLLFDHKCTGDAARILRSPTSVNGKNPADPKPVQVVSKGGHVYPWANLTWAVPANVVRNRAAHLAAIELSNPLPILKGCQQLIAQHINHGATASEPLWATTALLMSRVEEGRRVFHGLSKGHPGYSRASCDHKFGQQIPKQQAGIFATCKNFEDANPDGCKGCHFRGRIKTPLDLGANLTDRPPIGYLQDGLGIKTQIPDEKKQLQWMRISDSQFRDVEWYYNELGHKIFAPVVVNGDTMRRVRIDTSQLTSPSKLVVAQHLAAQSVNIVRGQEGRVAEMVLTWIDKLELVKPPAASGEVLGWNDEKTSFTFPQVVIGRKGRETIAIEPARGTAAERYLPHGELEDWVEASMLVSAFGDPALQVLFATTFAAPLMSFTATRGFTLAIRSGASGIGKTTTMHLAQAAWGSIDATAFKHDTANSVMKRLGDAPHMPFYWDEVRLDGEEACKAAVDLIFNMPSGLEKSRLDSNAKLRERASWSTVLSLTTNYNMRQLADAVKADPSALLARVFELEAHQGESWSTRNGAIIEQGIRARGLAGPIYISALQKSPSIQKAIDAERHALLKGIASPADSRFAVWFFSALLLGAETANRAGLTAFDMRKLRGFVQSCLNDQQVENKQTISYHHVSNDPMYLVSEWVRSERARWVVTIATPKMRKANYYAPRLTPIIHIDVAAREIVIPILTFNDWTAKMTTVKRSIRSSLPMLYREPKVRTFAPGTRYSSGRGRAFVFPFASLGLDDAVQNFIDKPPEGSGLSATHEEVVVS